MTDGIRRSTGFGQHLGEGNVRETHQAGPREGEPAQGLVRARQPGMDVAGRQSDVVVRVEPLTGGRHRRPHLPRHDPVVPGRRHIKQSHLSRDVMEPGASRRALLAQRRPAHERASSRCADAGGPGEWSRPALLKRAISVDDECGEAEHTARDRGNSC